MNRFLRSFADELVKVADPGLGGLMRRAIPAPSKTPSSVAAQALRDQPALTKPKAIGGVVAAGTKIAPPSLGSAVGAATKLLPTSLRP